MTPPAQHATAGRVRPVGHSTNSQSDPLEATWLRFGRGHDVAAVYTGDGRLAIRSRDSGTRPGEALVEVSHCGICGTDLHLVLERYARPGSVLGHEWSGTVSATGSDADAALIGTRVVANPTPGCGECRACRRGRPSVCLRKPAPDHLDFRGAFTQYVIVDAARLVPIPAALELRTAALTEPTAIALHAVDVAASSRTTASSSPAPVRSAC